MGPIDTRYRANFLPGNLAPGTEDFFNTKGFETNEFKFLTSQVNKEQQAMRKANQDIKKSTEG